LHPVSLVKYEKSFESTLERGLKLIGGFGSLKSPVLIKPNICTVSDDTGYSVTNVNLVEALIRLILQKDNSLPIRIVETDSQSKFAEEAYEAFHYTDLEETMQSEGYDVSLVNLSKSPLKLIRFDGYYFNDPELPDLLAEESYFISVAIAKTHQIAFLTGALKNQFGLLPRKEQAVYHSKLDEIIVDLNRIIRPSLSIIDARMGVEGWNGPKTREIGAIIMGKKPVSVDAAMARLMGFEPEVASHIIVSSKHNLGSLNPEILGENLESMRVQLKAPKV